MVLPGYISDIFGLFLIFKFTQNIFLKLLLLIAKPANYNSSVFKEHESEIIEGEFFDLDKKIELINNKKVNYMNRMKKKEQLTVNIQYIKDLSFENQNSPEALSNKGEAPAINVDVNVLCKAIKKKRYEVSLSINSKAEKKDFKVFELESVYAGIFTLPNINLNDEQEKRKILIEAPQLLFPLCKINSFKCY